MDGLRIWILIVGAAAVAGIYALETWRRRRRAARQSDALAHTEFRGSPYADLGDESDESNESDDSTYDDAAHGHSKRGDSYGESGGEADGEAFREAYGEGFGGGRPAPEGAGARPSAPVAGAAGVRGRDSASAPAQSPRFDIDEGWPADPSTQFAGVAGGSQAAPAEAARSETLLSDVSEARVEPTLNLSRLARDAGATAAASSTRPAAADAPARPTVRRRGPREGRGETGPHQLGLSGLGRQRGAQGGPQALGPANGRAGREPERNAEREANAPTAAGRAARPAARGDMHDDMRDDAPAAAGVASGSEAPAAAPGRAEAAGRTSAPGGDESAGAEATTPAGASKPERLIPAQDASAPAPPPGPPPAPSSESPSEPPARSSAHASAPDGPHADDSLIVVLNVLAREGRRFTGRELLTAFEAAGLEHGEQSLFHRPDPIGRGENWFSVANAVAPGVFEPQAMDEVVTPGIAMFLQVPGPANSVAAFDDMLATAKRLSARLDGRLCNQQRDTLAPREVSELRERISSLRA